MRRLAAALALLAIATPTWAVAASWRITVTDHTEILTDIPADSDDVGTALNCSIGEKVVHVYVTLDKSLTGTGDPPWSVPMTVTSGKVSSSFTAQATPDQEAGGTDLAAVVPASAPVMAAFARTGAIKLASSGETVKTAPVPPAKAARLVKVCGGA